MKIFIPTLNREGRQITINQIPEKWKSRTYLVCPKEEKHDWLNRVDVPEYCIGSIAKTRQWISEQSDDPYVGMIDDDIRILKRNPEKLTSSSFATETEMNEFLDMMERWLNEGDVFCGSSHSFQSHVKPSEYYYGKPAACYFMNRDFLQKHGIRYDTMFTFEDFHVPLSIMEAGQRLRYTGDYLSVEKKANAPGGCSMTRTAEKNRNSMIELQKLHPDYITLTEDPEAENQGLKVGLKMRIAFKKLYDERVLKRWGDLDDFLG